MNNEIYHYGVKGMKWGVRRNKSKKNGKELKNHHDSNRSKKEIAKSKKKTKKMKFLDIVEDVSNSFLDYHFMHDPLHKAIRNSNMSDFEKAALIVERYNNETIE